MQSTVATVFVGEGVESLASGGVLNAVDPSVRHVGSDIDICQRVLVDVEVGDNDAVGTEVRCTSKDFSKASVIAVHFIVWSLIAGADGGVDNSIDSVVQSQVHSDDAVATITILAIDSGGGIYALVVVGFAIEIPSVGVKLGGLKRATSVRFDSEVDGDCASAAVLGSPVGNGRSVVNRTVESVGIGQVNSLGSILFVDKGVVVCAVGALLEGVLAKSDFHFLSRGREDGESENVGRVAAKAVGFASG